ncbi:MAG: peptidoglycan-binding protein [Clostridia bacterium]|nr:peptidoglycan-binding protein [Clostridia bacterium]
MKRLLLIILCLVLSFFAVSEEQIVDPFACDCGYDEEKGETCACFLQEGDIGPFVNGVIVLLKEKGYLSQLHSRGVFDAEVTDAVKRFQYDADLSQTGMLDHETLTYLLFYDVFTDFYLMPEEEDALLWAPTDGGDHVHDRKECSNMIAPRKISERNALALAIEKCEHCLKDGWINE